MEEQIKRTAGRIKTAFVGLWVSAILLVVAGELGNDRVGLYADNERLSYQVETIIILLTAICVPVSLKLFSWILARKIDKLPLPAALHAYYWGAMLRLFLIALPVWGGLLTYYLLLSTTGLLCALIGLVASIFCLPGEARLRKDLCIDKNTDDLKL